MSHKNSARNRNTTRSEVLAQEIFQVNRLQFSELGIDLDQMRENRRKQHLKLFFELRDWRFLYVVDDMFKFYSFTDIAQGIYLKYRMFPIGWKLDLQNPRDGDKANLAWFKKIPDKEKVFLDERQLTWPPQNRVNIKSEGLLNLVVDEFVSQQVNFLNVLTAFDEIYVQELIQISQGRAGEEAQRALGLTYSDVKILFKHQLDKVLSAQRRFVVSLEPLIILKKGTIRSKYKSKGRVGMLCTLFLAIQGRLEPALTNYNVGFQNRQNSLAEYEAKVNQIRSPNAPKGRKTTRKGPGATGMKFGSKKKLEIKNYNCMNFKELWKAVSASNELLRGKEIANVTILPVQHAPRYNIFLTRLRKVAGPDHPVQADLKKVIDSTQKLVEAINKKMEKYRGKTDQFFGTEKKG